jgi:chemotaxis protein MotB
MQDGAPIIIKKVKKGGHGHHGGGWKVALADFMTSMMAFFMVMWIVGMSQEDREIIEAYFNDPTGFETTMPRSALNIGITGGPQSKKTGKAGTGTTKVTRNSRAC